ncbi:hypothetical protein RRF57_011552 [Xylaria bambusicola]|uniref:Uncharacterized protein n=1 Tax=Xylaria bambusicola TaxID=326684 RepID=A0AAN7Z3T2_9PEZI
MSSSRLIYLLQSLCHGAAGAIIISYHPETAIAAAVADVVSDPLPQATDLPELPAIVEKRDLVKRACQAQALGNDTIPEGDSAEGFLSFSAFKEVAESAKTPSGYALDYRNLNSSSNAYGYIGFTLTDRYL